MSVKAEEVVPDNEIEIFYNTTEVLITNI